MKSFVVVFALFTLTDALLNPTAFIKRSVNELMSNERTRLKRQANGPASAGDPMQCMTTCQPQLEAMLTSTGRNTTDPGDMFKSQHVMSMFNDDQASKAYDAKMLPNLCSKYKDLKKCFDTCDKSPMVNMMIKMFSVLDFMCIERYDDFVKYGECTWKAQNGQKDTCDKQCDAQSTVKSALATANNGGSPGKGVAAPDMSDMKEFGKVCTMMACELTCATPALTQACGTDEPSKLYTALMGRVMDTMTSVFGQMHMAQMVPDECKNLSVKQIKKNAAENVISNYALVSIISLIMLGVGAKF